MPLDWAGVFVGLLLAGVCIGLFLSSILDEDDLPSKIGYGVVAFLCFAFGVALIISSVTHWF